MITLRDGSPARQGSENAGRGLADPDGSDGAERDRLYQVPPDFDAFCRREYRSVLGLAVALTGDRPSAEELTQDALFSAYRRWDHVGCYDNPGAWVRRVVANRAVSHRRRLMAEVRALTRLGARPIPNLEIPEQSAELWAAVRRLPPRQAQVIALTYLDDLALPRVAEILEISEGTAKTHLQRGRAALSAALGAPATPPSMEGIPDERR
jgi:RNA polymerase sigma-70 factor (ECF subfamily)